jgi:hypothetical protein
MINGFFRMAFTGTAGTGFGMVILQDGALAGADTGGAIYNGSYTENLSTGKITINASMTAPEGTIPVQTGIPITSPTTIPLTASISSKDFAEEKPILLITPLGPVNVIFKKVRDCPNNIR